MHVRVIHIYIFFVAWMDTLRYFAVFFFFEPPPKASLQIFFRAFFFFRKFLKFKNYKTFAFFYMQMLYYIPNIDNTIL